MGYDVLNADIQLRVLRVQCMMVSNLFTNSVAIWISSYQFIRFILGFSYMGKPPRKFTRCSKHTHSFRFFATVNWQACRQVTCYSSSKRKPIMPISCIKYVSLTSFLLYVYLIAMMQLAYQ